MPDIIPGLAPLSDRELLTKMEDSYLRVTAAGALAALLYAKGLHANHDGSPLPKATRDAWKHSIDGAAVNAMARVLNTLPFFSQSWRSEGTKEVYHAGIAAPSLDGDFGNKRYKPMDIISDPVEGTTAMSNLEPCASSVLAVAEHGGLKHDLPEEIHYAVQFVGPPQLKGVIDLNLSHRKNLENTLDTLNIRDPRKLTQVTLDPTTRPVNQALVDAANDLGINLIIIKAGTLIPGVQAALDLNTHDQEAMVVATRTGIEEFWLTAVAARITGAVALAQQYHENPNIMKDNPIWTAEDLVPGDPQRILLSISGITEDPWMKIPAIQHLAEKQHIVRTWTLSSKGPRVRETILPYAPVL